MAQNSITVLSTYATDVLVDDRKRVISKQIGGPARFINQVFDAEAVPYQLFTNKGFTVKILLDSSGEHGKVDHANVTKSAAKLTLNDWVLVSTILKDWDLSSIKPVPRLFVDIQGYVRRNNRFGGKRVSSEFAKVADNIYCLKGTEEEIGYLPADIIEKQSNKLLLVTKGKQGVDVYHKGSCVTVDTIPVENLRDTVGAGDTFFAYVVAFMSRGMDAVDATTKACVMTSHFLTAKQAELITPREVA